MKKLFTLVLACLSVGAFAHGPVYLECSMFDKFNLVPDKNEVFRDFRTVAYTSWSFGNVEIFITLDDQPYEAIIINRADLSYVKQKHVKDDPTKTIDDRGVCKIVETKNKI